MFCKSHLPLLAALLCVAVAVPHVRRCPKYDVALIQDVGSSASDIAASVTKFRDLLGSENNGNTPGPLGAGHRSVNWDAPIVPFDMPGDFFKAQVTRGITFKSDGNEFRVSNPPASSGITDDRFSSILESGPHKFVRFSPERLFTSLNSTATSATFSIPASDDLATVSGFGAVFTNVAVKDRTFITYFDRQGCLIYKLRIPVHPNGLSFAGIKVIKQDGRAVRAPVTRVLINAGTDAISSAQHHSGSVTRNFVAIDDLVYGEPQNLKTLQPIRLPRCSTRVCTSRGRNERCKFLRSVGFGPFRKIRSVRITCHAWSRTFQKRRACRFTCRKICAPPTRRPFDSRGRFFCNACVLRQHSCRNNFLTYGPKGFGSL